MLLMNRITFNPDQYGGRPCIRGMRIRVIDVLDLLAAGLSFEDILEEMPDLEAEDIVTCLQFAARRIDHPTTNAPTLKFKTGKKKCNRASHHSMRRSRDAAR